MIRKFYLAIEDWMQRHILLAIVIVIVSMYVLSLGYICLVNLLIDFIRWLI